MKEEEREMDERERGERRREEFSSRPEPFPWPGDLRRERKTAGERGRERDEKEERGVLLSQRK